jgi:hypothetical protein
MTTSLAETSPSTRGRILAVLFLFVIVAGITAQVVISDRLIVGGDAVRTAANILADTSLYRLGFTIFMLEMVAQVAMTMLYYDLLKPVNRSVARLAAIIGLIGCGIKTLARLFYYAPLLLLGGAPYLAPIEPEQLEALSLAFIEINSQGAAIGLIFFGFESLLHGWLVFRSGFLPRFLGVLSMIAGLGWLTFLSPPLGYQAFMFVALFALIGSVATIGWLLIRGVDDVKWRARAALAASSIWR